MNEYKLRLALGVISGRIKSEDLGYDDWDVLGYDSYKFAYYGKPSDSELKKRCEDIILYAILESKNEEI